MLFKLLGGKKLPPILKFVAPGRRALGETWSEVTVRPNERGGFDVENAPSKAPAMGQPVIIPAMANLSSEEVDYILEGALQRQEYESRRPRRKPVTDKEIQEMASAMWHDYMEQKVRAFEGKTSIGAGGIFQRLGWGGDKHFNHHRS